MSPVDFLQSPIRWLQAISKYRATTSGGPNFAYDFCAQKITEAQKTGLDLSTWSVAFNGAEPIRANTLKRFTEAFASCGFRQEAFYPCYGMAESTLFVTGGVSTVSPKICNVESEALTRNQVQLVSPDHPNSRQLVSSGQTWLDMKVIVVDPESLKVCDSERVGEIWVSALSIANGYWQMPTATTETFVAGIGEYKDQRFLRTGD